MKAAGFSPSMSFTSRTLGSSLSRFTRTPLAIAVLAVATPVMAAPNAWNGGVDNNWFNAANWNDNALPAAELAVQISNGDTVVADSTVNGDALVAPYLYLGFEGSGHLQSQGNNVNIGEISLAPVAANTFDGSASLAVTNADINAENGINLLDGHFIEGNFAGDKRISLSHSNGVMNIGKIDHGGYLGTDQALTLNSGINLNNVVMNTASNENILAGNISVRRDSDNARISAQSSIHLTDVDWSSNPRLDLEIGSDLSVLAGGRNNSLFGRTNLTVERSTINGAWLEFAEYTAVSNNGDRSSQHNRVDNSVSASFIDSDIDLDFRMILGDVGARGEYNHVTGLADVSLVNTSLDVRLDVQLTDIDVEGSSYGEDRAFITATDSEIRIGKLLEIASYGSVDAESTGVLNAGVTLIDSTLAVGKIIQVADIQREIDNQWMVSNGDDSYQGNLGAVRSVITTQQLVAGSTGSESTITLNESFLGLSDVQNDSEEADAASLEAHEGALTLRSGNKLVMQVNGFERASADNARYNTGLYAAIDALQVQLGGVLEINLREAKEHEGQFDLIRVAKDPAMILGDGAFNGIQGDFSQVIINGLPDKAEAELAVVQETIDGVDYDIYRLNVAGSWSLLAGALLFGLAGVSRRRA